MKKKIPSVLVSVCNPAKELLPMWIWIISDVSWLQTDSWKWKILRCERLAVGINASKVAVNVKHQSPEYRPSEIFRPLVSKLANWHPRSCNATVSRKTESYSSRSLSLRREIHLRVWSKVYSLLLTWTRRLHQATLWHSLSLKCVSLTSLHVAKTDKWPDSNALLRSVRPDFHTVGPGSHEGFMFRRSHLHAVQPRNPHTTFTWWMLMETLGQRSACLVFIFKLIPEFRGNLDRVFQHQ